MIISESVLRQLVREAIISESFLDATVDSLRAIEFKGETYRAVGYGEVPGPTFDVPVVIFAVHKTKKPVGKPLEGPFPFKIKNAGSTYKLTKPLGYHYMPTKTPGLKFSSEKLDLGKSSGADWAVEIAGILGAIPGIGAPADIGAAVLASIKTPPDYLLAAISIICALPIIGVGAAFARPFLKKVGRKGAAEVGQQLGKALEDKGIDLGETTLTSLRKKMAQIWSKMTKPEKIELLADFTNQEADMIIKHLGETRGVIDEILDNLVVTGSKAGAKGLDDFARAVVKRTTAKLIGEVTTGQIRNACARWAKEIAKELPNNPRLIIGREFTIPQTGKKVVFKSVDDLSNTFFQSMEIIGITGKDAANLWKQFYKETVTKNLGPPTPAQIDSMTDMLVQKMAKIKIDVIEDASMWASKTKRGPDTRGLMKPGPPPSLFINFAAFAKKGLEETMQETMEHEMIHGIDNLLLSVLAGGDEALEALFKRKGAKFASDLASSGTLKGAGGELLDRYVFGETAIEKIMKESPKNLKGLTDWQYWLVRIGKLNAADIAYVSDPAEMFVRVQRISYWLKKNGFKANDWGQFFRRSADDMIDEVPDSDFFRSFFALLKRVADGEANAWQQKVGKSIYKMFDELV